jgi:hypothetical protein
MRAGNLASPLAAIANEQMRGVPRSAEIVAKIRETRFRLAYSRGLFDGAECDYELARSQHFPMDEAIAIANRSYCHLRRLSYADRLNLASHIKEPA